MKNNNIPEFLLCSTPELARQVLEKIERESDLKWYSRPHQRISEDVPTFYYPDLVIITDNNNGTMKYGSRSGREQDGITNFTKAEDFLNNNYMTNKTWENLKVTDVLIDENGKERNIGGIIDHLVGLPHRSFRDEAYSWFSKDSLIRMGYKIKGASEDKPKEIKEAILLLESIPVDYYGSSDRTDICKAIEMLKKLK